MLSEAVSGRLKNIRFLAWNLGRLSFVKPDKSQDYMAVHVTLTGLRGLTAPFLGVAIYNAIESRYPSEGSWSFALALCIITAGALGFYHLYSKLGFNYSEI